MKAKNKGGNSTPTKFNLITSTPKLPVAQKPTESSTSDDDSDDEADSDHQSKTSENTEKKKQLTKTRKKTSGNNIIVFLYFSLISRKTKYNFPPGTISIFSSYK